MPKVLIREYDGSTTGIPASDNFAVVVPGYFGDHEGNEKEVLIDYDVYELKSQKDFETYIGKHAGTAQEGRHPTLSVVNTAENANEYTKYLRRLTLSDFENNAGCIYKVTEVERKQLTGAEDETEFNEFGYLKESFTYTEKEIKTNEDGLPLDKDENPVVDEETGEGYFDDDSSVYAYVDGARHTVKVIFEPVEKPSDIEWVDNGSIVSVGSVYCIIDKGCEGADGRQDAHIGNQIAYELLGLGYTVLFKKLTANSELDSADFWAPLKDKSVFNFRYVMTGGYYSASAMNQICSLAAFNNDAKLETFETIDDLAGRGDCIALCDIDENMTGNEIHSGLTMKEAIKRIGKAVKNITANEYSAIFAPKVTYEMTHTEEDIYQNNTFPASFHYLACAARTFNRYNEWYAVAGYSRGISNYAVNNTTVKLGEIAINTLAPRILNSYTNKSVNLILHERGNYYLWGNRTGYALDNRGIVFHHFLNIRQLCCSIKKQLFTACKQFTFDPNSDLLWINFVNSIKPTLEAMVADQGIKGYTITRTANDKKALLTARIRIVPIEAVEDFDISIHLEDSLTGIVVNANETQA